MCCTHGWNHTDHITTLHTAPKRLTLYSRAPCVPNLASIDTVGVSLCRLEMNPEGVNEVAAKILCRCTFPVRIG